MKNFIKALIITIVLFTMLWFTGCSTPQEQADGCHIVVLDNCQYYSCRTYYGYRTLAHKGNCNNKIHKYENN